MTTVPGKTGTLTSMRKACSVVSCLVWAVLLVSLALTWGCSGIVSGKSQTTALPQTFGISGTISPAPGGSGATVTLSGAASATTTADGAGNYSFSGLANGIYTIAPSHAGYSFTPGTQSATVNGANVVGINFTATSQGQTFSVSGTISPVAGGSGATVTLSGVASATTTANSSGNYTFTGLVNGLYAVTPSHAGYAFAPGTQSVTVNGANVTGINFTATAQQTFSISGTISPITGGAGATVTLSGAAAAMTTSNGAGAYSFAGLANGIYTVTPTSQGFGYTPTSQNVTVSAANITGVNFTATPQATHTVALTWTGSPTTTVTGYNVYRSTSNPNLYAKVNSSLVPGLAYTDSTVQNGLTYYYVTTAVDANGESIFSNPVSAVIP
jgi:hypothetical protein